MLVDTSVWVDHLRRGHTGLVALLTSGAVCCHPFVIGELACGNLRRRSEILALLAALPALPKAEDAELLSLLDGRRLMGVGLGLVDVHLLASCLLAGATLWTRDAKLAEVAARWGLAAGN